MNISDLSKLLTVEEIKVLDSYVKRKDIEPYDIIKHYSLESKITQVCAYLRLSHRKSVKLCHQFSRGHVRTYLKEGGYAHDYESPLCAKLTEMGVTPGYKGSYAYIEIDLAMDLVCQDERNARQTPDLRGPVYRDLEKPYRHAAR
jgi:hypothetical protein